jgi:RNase P subunit RPR2
MSDTTKCENCGRPFIPFIIGRSRRTGRALLSFICKSCHNDDNN